MPAGRGGSPRVATLDDSGVRALQSIGRALCRTLVAEAERLGFSELFLGTDIPAFYAPLGAQLYEQLTDTHWIMRVRMGPSNRG